MSISDRESICIDAAHPALAGHFPGNPVVPGVVLLERVLDFAQRRFGLHADTMRLPQAKFLQPLLPGQTAEIVLERIGLERIGLERIGLDKTALAPVASETIFAFAARIRFRIERDGALLASGELIAATAIPHATDAA